MLSFKPAIKLTARQQEILTLIEQAIATTGAPPTRAEIAAQLGFKSINAAEDHLQALHRKGVIELISGTSRGIRLPPNRLQVVNQARMKQFAGQKMLEIKELAQLTLPLVGRVAAGSPILAQEHVEQTYQLSPSLFAKPPDYLLKVRGMSMQGIGICDGDLLAVQACDVARNGQIVVARVGDDVTVKRFEKKAKHIELHPENPDFQTIIVQPNERFAIEGIAVGLIRHSISY